MGMDRAWKNVFDKLSQQDSFHSMGCWQEEDFESLTAQFKRILEEVSDCENAIDVGCGAGYYCDILRKNGVEPVGLDYSEKQIERAKEFFPEEEFLVGSAYDLPFDKDEFDLAICIGLLQCVYDHETVIHEMSRVSSEYMIISTLLRDEKVYDPMERLHEKLKMDSWPTREYHPEELTKVLHEYGWNTTVILEDEEGSKIDGGFFILCEE